MAEHVDLEKRVAERTRDLEEANGLLEQRARELERLALTDPLTGLINRRAMDELANWPSREAFDLGMMTLRLGERPRCVIATTPKPTPLVKELYAPRADVVLVLEHPSVARHVRSP